MLRLLALATLAAGAAPLAAQSGQLLPLPAPKPVPAEPRLPPTPATACTVTGTAYGTGSGGYLTSRHCLGDSTGAAKAQCPAGSHIDQQKWEAAGRKGPLPCIKD